MKKFILLFSILMFAVTANSQMAVTTMELSGTEHDFGSFKEEDGKQMFDFTVTNTGANPLVIQNIVPSCGCTTPEWTRQPIAPGASGKITAIYDPKGRPGAFNKTLTVHSNTKPATTVLVIKGKVEPREKTIEELYTFEVGKVRLASSLLAFTNVKKTEKKIRVMKFINTSDDPVTVEFDNVPQFLTIKASPQTIDPGKTGLIEGTYDATKNASWGQVSNMIKIKLDGEVQQNKYLYVSANLVEDFSNLSKDELLNAPVFKVESSTVDLGKIKGKTKNEVEFKYTNEGKSALIIRHVRSTCGCTVTQQETGKEIMPGESGTIKAVFNSGHYSGKVTKAIYVYTNDPKQSETMLSLTAEVEQE